MNQWDNKKFSDDFYEGAKCENNSPWNVEIRNIHAPEDVLEMLCFDTKEELCAHLREHRPSYENGYYNLQGKDLSDSDLRGAHLVAADIRYADLTGSNLEGANMFGAVLVMTQFIRTKLKDAEFIIAEASGADFTGSDLTEEQFNDMLGWPLRLANGQPPPGAPHDKKASFAP